MRNDRRRRGGGSRDTWERLIAPLAKAVHERTALLFVGAGVSMSLGAPSFDEFLDRMAQETGHDPREFRALGDQLTLAEYYVLRKSDQRSSSLDTLRSWMEETVRLVESRLGASEIHRAIVALDFPVIYTTNYDPWLERSYDAHGKAYTKIARVSDIARHRPGLTEIVKLHGDFEDWETIVFTESSFFDRMTFEAPLDVKLRSDVLGRTVLFIGYSMSDLNIRYLVYRLQKQWERDGRRGDRPQSYIFLAAPNAAHETVLRSRGIEPLICDDADPSRGLLRFLDSLEREVGKLTR